MRHDKGLHIRYGRNAGRQLHVACRGVARIRASSREGHFGERHTRLDGRDERLLHEPHIRPRSAARRVRRADERERIALPLALRPAHEDARWTRRAAAKRPRARNQAGDRDGRLDRQCGFHTRRTRHTRNVRRRRGRIAVQKRQARARLLSGGGGKARHRTGGVCSKTRSAEYARPKRRG